MVETVFNNWVSATANEVQQPQTQFNNSGSKNKQLEFSNYEQLYET